MGYNRLTKKGGDNCEYTIAKLWRAIVYSIYKVFMNKNTDEINTNTDTNTNTNTVIISRTSRQEPTSRGVALDAAILAKDIEAGDVGFMDKDTRRRARNLAVDYNLVNLRKTGMPDEVLGFLVKSLHFHTPFYFLLMFIMLPPRVAPWVMVPLVVCLLGFFYFDGCFLTIIEYRLMGQDLNIIDPYIYWMGGVPTPKSRFYYTMGVTSVYFGFVALLVMVRRMRGGG